MPLSRCAKGTGTRGLHTQKKKEGDMPKRQATCSNTTKYFKQAAQALIVADVDLNAVVPSSLGWNATYPSYLSFFAVLSIITKGGLYEWFAFSSPYDSLFSSTFSITHNSRGEDLPVR
jgi:hypothetical protein